MTSPQLLHFITIAGFEYTICSCWQFLHFTFQSGEGFLNSIFEELEKSFIKLITKAKIGTKIKLNKIFLIFK